MIERLMINDFLQDNPGYQAITQDILCGGIEVQPQLRIVIDRQRIIAFDEIQAVIL